MLPLADKFRDVDNRSVKSGPLEYQNWWEGFRDPTLNKLIQIAYNQNLTLLSAGTRVLQARAILGISIGEFYPQVQQGTGSVIYNRTSAATPLSGPNATPSYFWTDALAAQAAWELDFWGKFRRGVESADAVYLASIASYDNVLVSLLGDVTATYIGIRTTEQLIAIARANVRRQEQALSIAKAKFQGGGASELDVFQATNVLEQTRASIPQLTIQLQQGENALCVLLGVPPQSLGMLLSRSVGRIPSPPRTIVVGIPARSIAPQTGRSRRRTCRFGSERTDRRRPDATLSGHQHHGYVRRLGQHRQRSYPRRRRQLEGRRPMPPGHHSNGIS